VFSKFLDMMPSGRIDGGRAVYVSFFNIISYFFYIVKPIGPHFTGKYNAYGRPHFREKKSHMVGPVGNTELAGRARRVHHFQDVYRPYSMQFRENLRPYRTARNGRNFAYGVLRSEIRARTAVHGPTNSAKEKRGAVSRLSC
jgi:hypothetical protein